MAASLGDEPSARRSRTPLRPARAIEAPARIKAVTDLLRRLGREHEAAVIVVTHDDRMLEGFDRVYPITDGRIALDPDGRHRETALRVAATSRGR